MHYSTQLRFVLVGALNTTIDFGVFNLLLLLAHTPAVVASLVSTSVAMVLSYVLNRTFVFKPATKMHGKEALQFFAVTIVGLWVVQSVVIAQAGNFLHGLLFTSQTWESDDIAKIIAIGASTVWNYLWYSQLVFADKKRVEHENA
jgi:putative flippase GtrA